MVGEAAGLGKLTVLSGLGQPLRAELDIGATKDELAGMTARLAPQDVFKQAGVDFATVLLDLRFAVEKRAGGQSIVKVTSSKPINEPFLDFLVELNWPAGRLVREYTFLLDPPDIAVKQAARPVAEARVVETVRGGGVAEDRSGQAKSAQRSASASKVAAEAKPAGENAGTHVVQAGETLRKIAGETKYDGVSLEQMLVGLFQNNPDAFVGQNINRLKAGAILNVPEKSTVESVSSEQARKVYVAQTGDWNNYRQKLAATTAKTQPKADDGGVQSSSGKITAKVEEKALPAEQSKDQVKVARTDSAKGGAAAKAADAAEQVAREKALKEAQERVALLEKNVADLQKLLEMKSQKLAELQQPPKEAAKPAEPAKPLEVAKAPEPAEAPKAAEKPKPDAEAKPVEPPKPEEPKAEAPKPVEPPKPVQPAKPVAPPPAPVEEPGFVDSLLEDPVPLAAGGGILALLAGYFMLKRRRSQSASQETTAAPMPSSLGPNSVFRMTGGQSVDTGNTPPQTGDFSQTGPGTIDTDEVDPVAEADVYMAYGRDTQAEEILLEALQKDPQRTAIHAKLLEIYANRRSLKQFETLASELYAQTAGVGPDWEKVAALGAALDPNNPLFNTSATKATAAAPVAALEIPVSIPVETVAPVVEPEPVVSYEQPVSYEPEPEVSGADAHDNVVASQEIASQPLDDVQPEEASLEVTDGMTLDFDLGEPTVAPELEVEPSAAAVEPVEEFASGALDALDFDLAAEVKEPEPLPPIEEIPALEVEPEAGGIDFDLNVADAASLLDQSASSPVAPDFSPEGTLVMPSTPDVGDIEMDIGLGTWVGVDGQGAAVDTSADTADEDVQVSMMQTIVNPQAGTDTFVGSDSLLDFGAPPVAPASTNNVLNTEGADADSLEFDVRLTDSVFLGEPMATPDFDIGAINLDLSSEPVPEAVPAPVEAPSMPAPAHDAQWEEVNTKLDLAKAYEEMGDLEGARELLQEVLGEGPVDLVEQARTILGRIGG